jgi:hypothetical protein
MLIALHTALTVSGSTCPHGALVRAAVMASIMHSVEESTLQ